MPVKIKRGDLLRAKETIIAHQVNCHGAAGGLAAAVFDKYPIAMNDYLQVIDRTRSRASLLGMAQLTGQQKDGHIIANLFGQYYPGEDYRPGDLSVALQQLAGFAKQMRMSVAIPYKISCGICGGDWNEVRQIIEETMKGVDCTIYRRDEDA